MNPENHTGSSPSIASIVQWLSNIDQRIKRIETKLTVFMLASGLDVEGNPIDLPQHTARPAPANGQ